MATRANRVCKWCGAEYEGCHTIFNGNMYRWQDVACCIEHGALYFEAIANDRGTTLPDDIAEIAEKAKPKKEVQNDDTQERNTNKRFNKKGK